MKSIQCWLALRIMAQSQSSLLIAYREDQARTDPLAGEEGVRKREVEDSEQGWEADV